MSIGNKRAALLERSLQGHLSMDEEIQELVATAGRISALNSEAISPRGEFVSGLALQLRAEALTLPARESRRVPSTPVGRRSPALPMIFVIGRGLPRILAGATASVLLVGALVGSTARSALPGGLLYPVKQLLNSAAVQLAGSDFDRGTTLLSQAQEHIADAATLVERDGADADPTAVNEALREGYDAASTAQRTLLADYDRTGNVMALIAIREFTAPALSDLERLQSLVPADSKPDLNALIGLLQDGRTSLVRKVAVCGPACALVGDRALGSSSVRAPGGGSLPSSIVGGAPGLGGGAVSPGGLPTGNLPDPGSTSGVTGPGGVVVIPSAPPLLGDTSGSLALDPPAVPLGPITVSVPPIVVPPLLPLPQATSLIPALPLLTSVPLLTSLPLLSGLP